MRLAYLIPFLLILAEPSRADASPGGPRDAPEPTAGPTVRVEKNLRMLTLVVKGDPARNGDSAVAALLGQFFQGAGEEEKNAPVRPRVRWLRRSPSLPREAWMAEYGLPVSESFAHPRGGPSRIAVWVYGLIADAAFLGPYEGAESAADSLKAFIHRSGFSSNGGWEEEYVRGRGTLYQGNPESYYTVVRYRMRMR